MNFSTVCLRELKFLAIDLSYGNEKKKMSQVILYATFLTLESYGAGAGLLGHPVNELRNKVSGVNQENNGKCSS